MATLSLPSSTASPAATGGLFSADHNNTEMTSSNDKGSGAHAELIAMIDDFIQDEKEKTGDAQGNESDPQDSTPGDYLVDTQSIDEANKSSQKEQAKNIRKITGDLDRFLEIESRKKKNLARHPSHSNRKVQNNQNSCANSLQYSADVEDCDGYQSVDESTTVHLVMATTPADDSQSHTNNDGHDGDDEITVDGYETITIATDASPEANKPGNKKKIEVAPTFDTSSSSGVEESEPQSPSRVKDIRRLFETKPNQQNDDNDNIDDDASLQQDDDASVCSVDASVCSVKDIRRLFETDDGNMDDDASLQDDASVGSLGPSLRRRPSFARTSTSSSNGRSSSMVSGGMEGFYRLQRLRKFAEREKVKETWNKHQKKDREVVRGLIRTPSAKARVYDGKSSWDSGEDLGRSVSESKLTFDGNTSSRMSGPPKCLIPYQKHDYRGFIFMIHQQHGLVLLHCTRKKNKPPHYQLPGGHVDKADFLKAARRSQDRDMQLLLACKEGAARELFEETGIDVRSKLDRLTPAPLREKEKDKELLENEFKDRFFFFLNVEDEDFLSNDGTTQAQGDSVPDLRLKLSNEHSGFMFEPDAIKASDLLRHHSGGKCAKALTMAMSSVDDGEPSTATTADQSTGTDEPKTAETVLSSVSIEDSPLGSTVEHQKQSEAEKSGLTTTASEMSELQSNPQIENNPEQALPGPATMPAPEEQGMQQTKSYEKEENMVIGSDECLQGSNGDDPYAVEEDEEDGGQNFLLDLFPQAKKKSFLCCFGFE